MTYSCFLFRLAASTIVKNVNPGPPESFSCVAQRRAAKSAMLPAQSDRLLPGVIVSKDILKTAFVVTSTGLPVSRYFSERTVPVMVIAWAFAVLANTRAVAQTAV